MPESLTVMTRSSIFDIVFSRTMIRQEEEESWEALPGLSRMSLYASFQGGGMVFKAHDRGCKVQEDIWIESVDFVPY